MSYVISEELYRKLMAEYRLNAERYGEKEVELEFRFGVFQTEEGSTSYRSGVTRKMFENLKRFFREKQGRRTVTVDHLMDRPSKKKDNVRMTVNKQTGETTYVAKEGKLVRNVVDFPIRAAVSRESVVPASRFRAGDTTREKDRTSYYLANGSMRLDLTTIEVRSGRMSSTKLEVELEVLDAAAATLARINTAVNLVLKVMADTNELYGRAEAEKTIESFNRLTGSWAAASASVDPTVLRTTLDFSILVQARNLKLRDMVYGGLIGNPKTSYVVTHKADGVRKILYFSETGVWLMMAPSDLSKISSVVVPELVGYAFDVENVPKENWRNVDRDAIPSLFMFVVFDTIAVPMSLGGRRVQEKNYLDRMTNATTASLAVRTNDLLHRVFHMYAKPFRQFKNAHEFFGLMEEMLTERDSLMYKEDGFMFVPFDAPYNPRSDQYELYRRELRAYPDVCKWKPKELLTIDFAVQHRRSDKNGSERGPGTKQETQKNDTVELYAWDRKERKLVKFAGTGFNPFPGEVSADDASVARLLADVPPATVVEFAWDYEAERLYPLKIRRDKKLPNRTEIANDVWDDIHNPIDTDILVGQKFSLLRRYHNHIKRTLLEDVARKGRRGKGREAPTLLDIGSGAGGDVEKWRAFSKVVAVEPNATHIEELERRIAKFGMKDRVRIVKTGGEDTNAIKKAVQEFVGGKVDAVSVMLSLSFFFVEGKVEDLVRTIETNLEDGGSVAVFTVDGNTLMQYKEPAFGTGPVTRALVFEDNAFIEFVPKDKKGAKGTKAVKGDKDSASTLENTLVKVHINNSIVTDQTEGLVDTSLLIREAAKAGLVLTSSSKADKQPFLSIGEKLFSEMYTSLEFEKKGASEPEYASVSRPLLPLVDKINAIAAKGRPQVPKPKTIEEVRIERERSSKYRPTAPKGRVEDEDVSTIYETVFSKASSRPARPKGTTTAKAGSAEQVEVRKSRGTEDEVDLDILKGVLGLKYRSFGEGLERYVRREAGEVVSDSRLSVIKPGSIDADECFVRDDMYALVYPSWYNLTPVVRIACLQDADGSGFVHALLKSFSRTYNGRDEAGRRQLVAGVRTELLERSKKVVEVKGRDTTIADAVLLKDDAIGPAFFQLASVVLDVDVYIFAGVVPLDMEGKPTLAGPNLVYLSDTATRRHDPTRKVVVLSTDGTGFELIGVEEHNRFVTSFSHKHPFVAGLKTLVPF